MATALEAINRNILNSPQVEARLLLADYLVDDSNQISFPVAVETIASELKIQVNRAPLDDNVAGLIIKSGADSPVEVFLNDKDRETRQRFTLAHEIGHFISRTKTDEAGLIGFVDYRNEVAGLGTDAEEIWANKFAAELLMPSFAVRKLWASGYSIQKLAREFDVSRSAMEVRISSLGLA